MSAVERERLILGLLGDSIRHSIRAASEYGSDLAVDYRGVVDDARRLAGALGVPWSDALVPEYARDVMREAAGR